MLSPSIAHRSPSRASCDSLIAVKLCEKKKKKRKRMNGNKEKEVKAKLRKMENKRRKIK